MRTPFSSLLLRLSSFALLFLCSVLTPQSSVLSQTVTSPPPAEIVFVPHPDGSFLTKHPTLPVLYLGCYIAPDAKNLATFQLNTDGTLNTNSMRAFNYFSVNPTNVFYRYQVQRPIVLPEEKILYAAAVPIYGDFFLNTNHQEIAAIALDDQGQPGKILKAIRTTHGEKEIRNWQFDPTTHRLYMSYHSYFGWIPIGKDGLPENGKFNLVYYLQTIWAWVYVPEWQRYYARQTDGGLIVFKLGADGLTLEFNQVFYGPYRGGWNFDVSPGFRKTYILDRPEGVGRLIIHPLTAEGRIMGMPRVFPMVDTVGIRFDFKTNRLYAWNDKAVLTRYQLDERGIPKQPPGIFALNCGAIHDLLIDGVSGKVYVACTEMPGAPK